MPRLASERMSPCLFCAIALAAAAATGWQHIGNVQRVEKLKDGVELTAGKAKLRVTVFRDGIFRVRVAPQGTFPKDFSWAVIETPEPPAFKVEDGKNELRMTVGTRIVIANEKSPLLINFADSAGMFSSPMSRPCLWPGMARACHAGRECRPRKITTDSATNPAP